MKLTRRDLLASAAALALPVPFVNEAEAAGWLPLASPQAAPAAPGTWKPLKIGAGGAITGIDVASDGKLACKTDVFSGYLWNPSTLQWEQISQYSRMPSAYRGFNANGDQQGLSGSPEVCQAPSNSDIAYLAWQGTILKTTNRGATWSDTGWVTSPGNVHPGEFAGAPGGWGHNGFSPIKLAGMRMAIDPVNPDVV